MDELTKRFDLKKIKLLPNLKKPHNRQDRSSHNQQKAHGNVRLRVEQRFAPLQPPPRQLFHIAVISVVILLVYFNSLQVVQCTLLYFDSNCSKFTQVYLI